MVKMKMKVFENENEKAKCCNEYENTLYAFEGQKKDLAMCPNCFVRFLKSSNVIIEIEEKFIGY